MNRIAICFFLCLALNSAAARGQSDGIAQLQTEGGIFVVQGFITNPSNDEWVIAEFQDAYGVIGYSDALVDTQTGCLLSISELDFEFADMQSLTMNLFNPGSTEPFAIVVVIEEEGVIHELTDDQPNPPTDNELGPLKTDEKWIRDKVLGVTSQDNPQIFRTEPGKGMGDFVIVRFGQAVVVEVKTPTGGEAVDEATVSDGSDQISDKKNGHIKTETGATVTGGITVTLPSNPDDDDWQIIWTRLKELTPKKN
jgi:hypothetical protein